MTSPSRLTHFARPAALLSKQTWRARMHTGSHFVGGLLLASPGTLRLRLCGLASRPLHSMLRKALRSARPIPAAVAKHKSSVKWKTQRESSATSNSFHLPRSPACGMECSKCRIVVAGQVGRKPSRPTAPILRWTLAQASLIGWKEKTRTSQHSWAQGTLCTARDRARGRWVVDFFGWCSN